MLKNWFRIFYMMLCGAGVILYLALFALLPKGVSPSFSLVCFILAPIMFFLGTIAYNALKMCDKTKDTHASYVQLATGIVVTILFGIAAHALFKTGGIADMVAAMGTNPAAGSPTTGMARWISLIFVTIGFFGHLIVFGLMPMLKGIQKTLAVTPEFCCSGTVQKAKPAPVAQEKPKATRKPSTPKAAPQPKVEEAPVAQEPPKPRKPRTK